MIVEIIPASGVGGGAPVVLRANQVVIRRDDGTPISLAAVYGSEGSEAVSCVGCKDFLTLLRNLGIHTTVIVDRLKLPKPPPGAVLVAGPDYKESD
jgi:hypothetical protein